MNTNAKSGMVKVSPMQNMITISSGLIQLESPKNAWGMSIPHNPPSNISTGKSSTAMREFLSVSLAFASTVKGLGCSFGT
ncbi:hypothetical protein ACR9WD_00065 [Glutamicibacter sp. PAEs-4]|uniref:hypothetical protein n=1 Tax=Glutamicibacter sp. PAEs-4 TaxID=3444114 RepID=UPI003EBE5572